MIPLCSLWSTENVQWRNSNWTWAECEMVQEICQVWSTTQFPWNMADWKWSQCSSSVVPVGPCKIWGTTNVLWANANWKWSECSSSVPPPVPVVHSVVMSRGHKIFSLLQFEILRQTQRMLAQALRGKKTRNLFVKHALMFWSANELLEFGTLQCFLEGLFP